ncbi:ABC transporter substrate-binding protein [Antarctobacter heliothermus]|uniref:Amino acid/amide ABC transporter substrate-binding protein, HAAT family (TC 3.A.1.4.-) n=1 Tax=Antarctobacter heliothermus TaxID=74033 RepID=A0A239ICH0_9RHOB|nr:ABC transporter substrate-binding protein [Antarctobacter heliothermus]SNS90968.1 amino acid/amide ABC transporter substrate-binding protein, HAAT family (TC 3.A.1.4.-) [Antarctobacter heliothermus]
MFLRTVLALCLSASAATADVSVVIHYLRQDIEQPPVLSNLDPIPEDLGLRGAELALKENTTTGRFLGQTYTMEVTHVPPGGDLPAAARSALALTDLIVLDAPAEALLAVADLPEAANALIFNASAPDDSLRGADCRANLLHSLPSNAMRTDALAQFLVQRRWDDLALIAGTHPDDIAFADALHGSLTKFGLRLRSEKTWAFDADMRRTASQEVPLFTQDLRDHDILLIADEIHDFGRYIAYNTWDPRPVAGSEGLVPVTWSHVVEQWGAAQLQSRFDKLADRPMRSRDYAAWAAVRSIGEAVTRTGSGDTAALRTFLLGPDFELAGFKGRPMSYRNWNGQLRQPIPLVTDRALVAQAPLEGFLHQTSELDTLGQDRPESACTAF